MTAEALQKPSVLFPGRQLSGKKSAQDNLQVPLLRPPRKDSAAPRIVVRYSTCWMASSTEGPPSITTLAKSCIEKVEDLVAAISSPYRSSKPMLTEVRRTVAYNTCGMIATDEDELFPPLVENANQDYFARNAKALNKDTKHWLLVSEETIRQQLE